MNTWIEISRSAYLNNIKVMKELCPQSLFCGVIKSNAYGHGIKEAAEILKGQCDWFAVNTISEAEVIRMTDSDTPIMVLGRNSDDEYKRLSAKDNITVILSNLNDIKMIESLSDIPFHLKTDTGLHRLGSQNEDFESAVNYLSKHPELNWTGLMTHFANVEDVTDQNYAKEQLHLFTKAKTTSRKAAGLRKLLYHTAASAPAMLLPESREDLIRIGISLYGLWPSPETRISLHSRLQKLPELKPVMRWLAKIVNIKEIKSGSYVGYGCTYKANSKMRIGVLPVGYFEGYGRELSNKSYVLIHGKRAPVIGRVSMNMIVVDISNIPQVKIGDTAVLIGESGEEEISADTLAGLSSTINYEIVTKINPAIPRIITD